jgi:hypothetical protein
VGKIMANYSTRVIVTLDFDHIPEREEIENTLLDIIKENELVYETAISPVDKPLVSIKARLFNKENL